MLWEAQLVVSSTLAFGQPSAECPRAPYHHHTHAAYSATVLGIAPLGPPPTARVALTKLLPVSASFAASLFLGNYAYLGLSGALC